MKFKTKKIILSSILLLIVIFPVIDILVARQKTPELVSSALQNKHCVLKIEEINKRYVEILLIVEDPHFYIHKGVDLTTPGAGLTTISQGLVKIFYFENFTPGIKKIRQTWIARFVFDPLVSKKQQLQLFINYAYLGNTNGKPIMGFEQASLVYYKKRFADLCIDEFLSLVAMLLNPNQYNIITNHEKNQERVRRIKKLISMKCHPIDLMDSELNCCK